MSATNLARWHAFMAEGDRDVLDGLLAEDVVFHSPVVFTPQRGKAVTTTYLTAAAEALGARGDGPFRYVREVVDGDTAVLEFETELNGVHVDGVDIITWDDDGLISDFKVMVRPLQAINAVHASMRAMLERPRSS